MNKKPSDVKICVNAMVGNEAATIKRMLESVADYVDYYVIQCNGTDATKETIDGFFEEKGIPGFTYEINWEYPGWNRDHTLQAALKADHGCDWILRMDADEQLRVEEDFDWNLLRDTSVQSWNIVADPGNSLYFRTWMWNAKLPWFFQHDKRHETIHLPEVGENFQRINLPTSFRQIITNDGETWFKPMKFLTDALELELDKVPSNKVLEDNYHLWYIAKSYNDAYGDPTQFPFGMDHAREYARRSIFYYDMYLNRQHNYNQTRHPKRYDDMGYYAMMLVGQAYEFLGEDEKALQYYLDASKFNTRRNEHYLRLCFFYESRKQYQNMLGITTILTSSDRFNPFPEYSFLIENNAYKDTGDLVYRLHEAAKQYVQAYV
jgi:hypothetical protein